MVSSAKSDRRRMEKGVRGLEKARNSDCGVRNDEAEEGEYTAPAQRRW